MLPHTNTGKKIEIGIFLFIFLAALIYGIFRAVPLLSGPSIEILSPKNGDVVASTTFEISGRVLRAKEILLQGKPISTDTEGYFSERLVSSSPYTIIILVATDKYGRREMEELNVVPN